eukprot:2258110-Rhodomonas_salina.2
MFAVRSTYMVAAKESGLVCCDGVVRCAADCGRLGAKGSSAPQSRASSPTPWSACCTRASASRYHTTNLLFPNYLSLPRPPRPPLHHPFLFSCARTL